MRILVTGGAGYIGSHACLVLLENGYDVVAIDNLSNSSAQTFPRISQITGKYVEFRQGDIRDQSFLRGVFEGCPIDAVMHFAGLKSVADSCKYPLDYYDNNVAGSITLFKVMAEFGVRRIIFSSSATVYGAMASMPVGENAELKPVNPYGRTKLVVEQTLQDIAQSSSGDKDTAWSVAILRYFNPVGAHESGVIGESPRGIPNNLMPFISQVAVGRLPYLSIFGNDYSTHDGTGVRDYIHVMDLVEGHLAALQKVLMEPEKTGCFVYNLGTGIGYSVMDMVNAFEKYNKVSIPCRVAPRRLGDVPECWADPGSAATNLGWAARRGVKDMVLDHWRWQQHNPDGI